MSRSIESITYVGSCPQLKAEFIWELQDEGEEIPYDEFIEVVGEDILKEFFPDYDWEKSGGLEMKDDFAVSFKKFTNNRKFYFVQWSGMEFVWENQ